MIDEALAELTRQAWTTSRILSQVDLHQAGQGKSGFLASLDGAIDALDAEAPAENPLYALLYAKGLGDRVNRLYTGRRGNPARRIPRNFSCARTSSI